MNDFEKKQEDAREMACAMKQITREIKDENARRMVIQRVAGIVEGASLAQAALDTKAS